MHSSSRARASSRHSVIGVAVVAIGVAVGVLAFASAPARAAPTRAQRVAVYDLEANAVPERLARVMTDAVVEEIRKLEGVAVVGMSEIRAMLDHEAEKQLAGCTQDSCVSEIAEALGVDALVVGSLAAVGTDWVWLIKRIDQQAASTAGSYSARVALDDEESLLAQVGVSIEKLFPDRALRPGMTRGVSDRVSAKLHPPPLPAPVFYSALATTGVLFLGASVLTAPALLSVNAFETYKADPANKDAYDLKEHTALGEGAQLWLTASVAVWGSAAAAGLVTLAAWPFTDFAPDDDGAVSGASISGGAGEEVQP